MSRRLEKLRELEETTRLSIDEAPVDKRSPLIAQMRGILAEIAELEGSEDEAVESNGLISFQAALAERQSTPKGSRSSSRH